MRYRVVYSPGVHDDIRIHVAYLREQGVSGELIERWFSRLFRMVEALEEMPTRFAVDRARSASAGVEIRRVTFGSYLVFFRVAETERRVDVLAFVHGGRRGRKWR